MAQHTIYQTLELRDDGLKVEDHGPYICKSSGAWLGEGYYFWDYHIDLAHWWGNLRYSSKGLPYLICEAKCELNEKNCWDLHNNGKHQKEFIDLLIAFSNSKIANVSTITVSQIIEYAKLKRCFNKYAVRANGIDSTPKVLTKIAVGTRLKFNFTQKWAYYELFPPIQVCIIHKEKVNFNSFIAVYPDDYGDNLIC